MPLLSASHHRQRQQADCLAACAAMVLDFLQLSIGYEQLLRLLGIRYFGAPFSSLRKLGSLGVTVLIARGDLATLRGYLEEGYPVIVAVNTLALPYWNEDTAHALVVVGFEHDAVLLNDPEFVRVPQTVSTDLFLLAWLEQDYRYAVIKLAGAA